MNKAEIHMAICERLTNMYQQKNSDYGNSFAETRKVYPEAICLRLQDKINRLRSLIGRENEAEVKDESIEDTLLDIANYAIMEIIERTCETTVYSSKGEGEVVQFKKFEPFALQKDCEDSIKAAADHFSRADKKETEKLIKIFNKNSFGQDEADKAKERSLHPTPAPLWTMRYPPVGFREAIGSTKATSDTTDRTEKKCETCAAWSREPMCGGLVSRYGKCAKAKGMIKPAASSCDKWEAKA